MTFHRAVILAVCLAVASPPVSVAQGKAVLAREAAEYVMRKFGKEAAEVGVETLTRKIETLAIKHGDEVFLAVRKVGPRTLRIVEEAGEHGLVSVKLMARYGDEAVWVVAKKNRMAIFVKYGDNAAESMMKHGEIAEPLLSSFGKPAAGALNSVSSQNARRLAMLAEDGQLAKIGQTPDLLEVVAKYGDRAADFIWRNKGALTVTAALTAFLANPEPFLDGAADITKIVAENAVKPIADVPGQVASEAAKNTNWTLVVVCGVCVLGALGGARLWLRHRASTAKVPPAVKTG
jgi:hypothetical protein